MATRRKKAEPKFDDKGAMEDMVVSMSKAETPPSNNDRILKVIANQIGIDKNVEGKQIRVVERLYRSERYLAIIYASLEPLETRYAVYGMFHSNDVLLQDLNGNLDRVMLTYCNDDIKFLADAGLITKEMWVEWRELTLVEYHDARTNGEDLYRFRSLLNIR